MIDRFVNDCLKSTNNLVCAFGLYFKNNYANRANEWALCLRGHHAYTTNMVCERFHFKLKREPKYMDNKHNTRIDALLGHIFAIEGEMMKRNLNSFGEGSDKQERINFQAHQAASAQSISLVTETQQGWEVKNFEKYDVIYQVTKTEENCPFETECSEKCNNCNACWHLFKCTCEAAENAHNRYFSCKHAHLVCM